MNQKRTPRGVPAGGQFENNDHDEARHWLSSSPAPTVPNTTSAIRRDGTAALMLPGSGRKIVLDLGASPYCDSSGIYSASTNSVRLRYGVESEKSPSPIPAIAVRPAESREVIAASVAKLVAKGKNPDSIYVAAKTHDGFYLVTQDEAAQDTFDNGGYIIEASSPDDATAKLSGYRELAEKRHFDVYERIVQMDGSMSEPEVVAEYADTNHARQRAFFRDDD